MIDVYLENCTFRKDFIFSLFLRLLIGSQYLSGVRVKVVILDQNRHSSHPRSTFAELNGKKIITGIKVGKTMTPI